MDNTWLKASWTFGKSFCVMPDGENNVSGVAAYKQSYKVSRHVTSRHVVPEETCKKVLMHFQPLWQLRNTFQEHNSQSLCGHSWSMGNGSVLVLNFMGLGRCRLKKH